MKGWKATVWFETDDEVTQAQVSNELELLTYSTELQGIQYQVEEAQG